MILLLAVIFLLYRKRLLCFGKMKQKQKPEKNIHVELQNIDNTEESKYDRIDDNVGNPLYASVGGNSDDTQPMLSPVKKKPDEFIPPDGESAMIGTITTNVLLDQQCCTMFDANLSKFVLKPTSSCIIQHGVQTCYIQQC